MYSVWAVVAGIFFIWAAVLTYFEWKQNNFLHSIFPKSGDREIRRKFEEILAEVNRFKLDLSRLEKAVSDLDKKGYSHIQRVELMRFNPYGDTGGDQSFVVVMLDNKANGFVLTSLHARSGTRVFAKEVILGKSGKYKFSEEEEKTIKKALER